MFEGGPATSRRLPFRFQAHGGVGRLTLTDLAVGLVTIDRLDLEVAELGTDPGAAAAERFQRRRTQLRGLAVRLAQPALDERVAQVRKQLAGTGITQLSARLTDGYISVRARAADGLAAADLSFHIDLVSAGAQLRALASTIRVHGHLPTPGPVIADRLLVALTGAGDASRAGERPCLRGLCDVELDLVGALLWHVLPPSGWRLPAVAAIELTHIRVARAGIEVAYGPAGARTGELGVRKHTPQLAAAHDLMHSVDDQMRGGHLEDAMRGYRALLASGGPDQPLLLERILALAAARPAWFFDGLELARQALGRWPAFAPAHAALASITLSQGDAREAAHHLEDGARMASAESDDDQAALAALAAARLLRVLDPRAATQLYQLALEHDPASTEAADSLTDRLADEQRWSELVRLVRTRMALAAPPRAVQLHLRLADVFVHQLGDHAAAQRELATARELAPDDPAVHEMTASILAPNDPAGAMVAWREVARLAEHRGDHRTGARASARLGDLLAAADPAANPAANPAADPAAAEDAWRRALQLDPMQADAMVGLAHAAAARGDHAAAAGLYERLRGVGLAQAIAARHELSLARSLIALGRTDDARASLRRATLAGGEAAAEAHAVLAEIAAATLDRDHAAAELDTAIASLVELAAGATPDGDRLYTRAAELAVERAMLFDRSGQPIAAGADWQRAHALARQAAPEIARDAARTLLARSGDDASLERRWIDAVLATRPPPSERATLLVRRADVRRRERFPDLAAALADLHEAVELTEESAEGGDAAGLSPDATETRRRAYQLEAELFAQSGDQRSRARSLTAIARLAVRAADRVESEAAAAAAWLAADEPAAALPHGARAHASLSSTTDVPAALRREVLVTLGEAAWRQRAWPDVIRAYRGLLDDPGPEAHRQTTFRYRLAVAADRTGDAALALSALRPLTDDPDSARGASPELRAHALRLFADLAERTGELSAAAAALEGFAAIGGESSAAARADAVYRAGELFRRIERGDDVIRCLETALRISDSHLPALDALEVAWRERGDLERVAVILGRKVAATVRQPGRQKPLLSRLGDLQDQLRRPDVALATHQRALEIDPMWRPSLRYVTLRLRDSGQVVAAAGGLAQLAGELHGDQGVDLAIVTRERQIAAEALSELVAKLDDAQVEAVRAVARPALERAALDNADVAAGLARLRGEAVAAVTAHSEADTQSGRVAVAAGGALSLREAAARARAARKLDEALATLETANHVSPGDPAVLRELVEIASELHDYAAAARHLSALALALAGARRGDALLELADIYYDRIDDAERGRDAMRQAAEAFGSGSRRDATLRLLATEAGTHLAWDIAVESLLAIAAEKRNQADFLNLATALMRAGRDADALAALEAATAAGRFDDDGELLGQIQREIQRKTDLARSLEDRAAAGGADTAILVDEAQQLRLAIGQPGNQPLRDIAAPDGESPRPDTAPWPLRTKTRPGLATRQVQPAPVGARPRPTPPPPLGDATRFPDDALGAPIAVIADDDALSGRVTSVLDTATVHSAAVAAAAVAAADDDAGHRSEPIPVPVPDIAVHRSRPVSIAHSVANRSGPIPAPDTRASSTEIDLAMRSSPAIALADIADADQTSQSSPAISIPAEDLRVPEPIHDPPAITGAVASESLAAPPPSDAIPTPTSSDDSSGDWQSVSNPDLKSGAWAPLDAPRPASTTRPPRRATSEPRLSSGAIVAVPDPPPDATIEATPPPAPKARITALYAAVNVDDDPELSAFASSIPDAAPSSQPAADPAPPAKRPSAETPAQSPTRITSQYPLALIGPAKLPARPSRAGFAPSESGAARDASDELTDDVDDAETAADPVGPSAPRRSTAELPAPTVRPAFDRSGPVRVPPAEEDDEEDDEEDAQEDAQEDEVAGTSAPTAGGTRGNGVSAERATAPYDSATLDSATLDSATPRGDRATAPYDSPGADSAIAEPANPAAEAAAAHDADPATATADHPTAEHPPADHLAADHAAELAAATAEPAATGDAITAADPTTATAERGPDDDATISTERAPADAAIAAADPTTATAERAATDLAPATIEHTAAEDTTAEDTTAMPAPAAADTASAPGPLPHRPRLPSIPPPSTSALAGEPAVQPSVTITGTPEETQMALLLAAASADRERLFAARRADPDDPAVLLALLAHLGDREPAVRRELLDEVVRTGHGRALAIALHELAVLARESRNAVRAMSLWTRAYETDPSFPAVWMPLADAFAASDDMVAARELYEAIARSDSYDPTRRAFAAERAEALGRDESIVSGEIPAQREMTDLEEAEQLAAAEDWPGALDAAERAAAASPEDLTVLEVLERIYFASGNVTAASESVGRQLLLVEDPQLRAGLWRRRARMYRDSLGRDAEAYRCLKEAHACSPADPEIAYQLRTAAMVRGEWQLAASLLYREIAASANPRDRGALHLELAMIYEERLDDAVQAQVNYEQSLAFDPTIPAVKLPLARRYEAIGRSSDAARLYEEAAGYARPADRAGLLESAARCRQAATEAAEPDLAAQLDRAEAAGDLDAALELASQLWRAEPGHPAAFRTLANTHRASGDLAALSELTRVRVSRADTADERATAWLEVARLAEEIEALDQAARAYDLALIEDPGHISALDARGALAFRLGDFATADLIYRDLGSGESVLGDDELALRRSIIAEQLGRDSEALHLAQLAASLAPGRRDVVMRVQELATRVGELAVAIAAARHVLELIPLDDDEAQLAVRFALVELLREAGLLDDAVVELERVLRDHPVHAGAIEMLAHVHTARGDWAAVTRYLYQLVPLAPSPLHRAERLYQLGEAVLVHVNDLDRADDVFLRASDLDPSHVPTLRRLLDVYWRADDPGGIVEVATELADKGALINGPTPESALARALVAAALVGDTALAQQLQAALGEDTPRRIADALTELVGRTGRLQLGSASIAITELARRGFLDLAKLRAAAAGTPVAKAL